MIKKLCKLNDNLLSFLCGIFSNIPISLLFAMAKWGNNWLEHAYFLTWILAFVVSVVLTVFAFSFTIRKIAIQKAVEKADGELAQDDALDKELKKKIKKKGKEKETQEKILFRRFVGFVICAVILLLIIVALCVLHNLS